MTAIKIRASALKSGDVILRESCSDSPSVQWHKDDRGYHRAVYMDSVSLSVVWDQDSCSYWIEVQAAEKVDEYYRTQIRWSSECSNFEDAKRQAELQAVAVWRAWEAFQGNQETPSKPSEPMVETNMPTQPTTALAGSSGRVATMIAQAREEFIAKLKKIMRED